MDPRKKPRPQRDASSRGDVITLDDLAPHHDVKGGAGRRFFGERLDTSEGVEVDESQ